MVASFFPTPYSDETLYSLIGRYHLRSGNISFVATLNDLFNYETEVSVDLPSGISNLVKSLPKSCAITEKELINNHTHNLFYITFLPNCRRDEIYQSMIQPKGQRIHYKAGIMGSTITLNQFFKYCPMCSLEDLENHGELYWHRLHQTPGIEMCIRHNVWLMNSIVPIDSNNKYEIQIATEQNCDLTNIKEVEDIHLLNQFQSFVTNIEKLLNNSYPDKSLGWFHEIYSSRLMEKGFRNINGNIQQSHLKEAFVNYHGESFLRHLQSSVNGDKSWLSYIVRKPRKSNHPIRHLLLMDFLGLSLEDVFTPNSIFHPFGNAPWPCLNPACIHYLKDVIQTMIKDICKKTSDPLGLFECECGFKYSRRGFEKSKEDRYKISRVKEFGHVWKAELNKLIKQNLSIREMGRRLNADGKTIKRYAESNLPVTNRKSIVSEEKLILYRRKWEEIQFQYPEKSKTELRKVEPKTYYWLYTNDRDWFNLNSPKPKRNTTSRERVNWGERDNELLEKVTVQVQQLLNKEGKPTRVSRKRVGTLIGKRALLEKKLDKLPQTKEYLDSVVESTEQFRERKKEWAIQELERRGEEVRAWRVKRLVGINLEKYEDMV
ncbi:TnsD family Tn7-like transposition protein [Halalkalibacter akibai]|uniref:Tn7-like transposition protein D n=1 Tax=Halalkalibacter akibai (strain ATCC 43226 / DSM 21942 / CIP 109018 / JCM 9157 / 1139) TaxID=1236973 RepID=W4R111_HALA3|nr:TnsD family Tn7-like transposition protein [Halalkalibacter akibai]GAE37583.1 Tn7-like transposition protein D [Halalkalibacter akibai JCM 9157]